MGVLLLLPPLLLLLLLRTIMILLLLLLLVNPLYKSAVDVEPQHTVQPRVNGMIGLCIRVFV